MTEKEAIEWLAEETSPILIHIAEMKKENPMEYINEAVEVACDALEEIQQYRAYKEIFESHFSQEVLELLSDEVEFGKWLERGKWIAKRRDEINRELEAYRAIGTIEEFKALKEKNVVKPTTLPFYGGRCTCGIAIGNKSVKYCYMCGAKFDWEGGE